MTYRFKLVRVENHDGPPAPDELILHFGIMDEQKQYLEQAQESAPTAEAGDDVRSLLHLLDGIQDAAVHLGVPDSEVFPRSCNND